MAITIPDAAAGDNILTDRNALADLIASAPQRKPLIVIGAGPGGGGLTSRSTSQATVSVSAGARPRRGQSFSAISAPRTL